MSSIRMNNNWKMLIFIYLGLIYPNNGNYILFIITLHCWLRCFAWSVPLLVSIACQCLYAIFGYRTLQRPSSSVIWCQESVTALFLFSARWVGSGTLPDRLTFVLCYFAACLCAVLHCCIRCAAYLAVVLCWSICTMLFCCVRNCIHISVSCCASEKTTTLCCL